MGQKSFQKVTMGYSSTSSPHLFFHFHHRRNRVCYGTGGNSCQRCTCWRRHPSTVLEARGNTPVPTTCGENSLGTGRGLRSEGSATPRYPTFLLLPSKGPHGRRDPLPLLQPYRHVRQVGLPFHPPQGWGCRVQDADGDRGTCRCVLQP